MPTRRNDEENDLPFTRNNQSTPGTMDKPLDTADAPGKADSELVEDEVSEKRFQAGNGRD